MARALTTARATVPGEREAEYLGVLRQLAARMKTRGEHLWVFRNPREPGAFLECSESPSPDRHRTRAGRDAPEAVLEATLAAIASYAPEDRVLWEEVSLEEG